MGRNDIIVYGYNELHFNKFLQGHGVGFKKEKLADKDIKSLINLNRDIKKEVIRFNKKLHIIASKIPSYASPTSLESLTSPIAKKFAIELFGNNKKRSTISASSSRKGQGIVNSQSPINGEAITIELLENNKKSSTVSASSGRKGQGIVNSQSPINGEAIAIEQSKNTQKYPTDIELIKKALSSSRPRNRALSIINTNNTQRSNSRRGAGLRKNGGASTLSNNRAIENYRIDYLKALYLIDAYHDFSKDNDFKNYINGKIALYYNNSATTPYLKDDVLRYFTGTTVPSGASRENYIFNNVFLSRILGNVQELQTNVYFISSNNSSGATLPNNTAPSCHVLGTLHTDPKTFFEIDLGFLDKSAINDVFPNTKERDLSFKEQVKKYSKDLKKFISAEVVFDPLNNGKEDVEKFIEVNTEKYDKTPKDTQFLEKISVYTNKIFNVKGAAGEQYMSGFSDNTKDIFNIVYYYNILTHKISVALLFKNQAVSVKLFENFKGTGKRKAGNDNNSGLPIIGLEKQTGSLIYESSSRTGDSVYLGVDIIINNSKNSASFTIDRIIKIKNIIDRSVQNGVSPIESFIAEYIKGCCSTSDKMYELLLDLKKSGDAGKVLIAYYINEDKANLEKLIFISNDTLSGLHSILRLNTDVITGYNPGINPYNISSRQILVYTARDNKIASYYNYFVHKIAHTFHLPKDYRLFKIDFVTDAFRMDDIFHQIKKNWLDNVIVNVGMDEVILDANMTQLERYNRLQGYDSSSFLFSALRKKIKVDYILDLDENLSLSLHKIINYLTINFLENAVDNIRIMAVIDTMVEAEAVAVAERVAREARELGVGTIEASILGETAKAALPSVIENDDYKRIYTDCTNKFYQANMVFINYHIYNISITNNEIYNILSKINKNIMSSSNVASSKSTRRNNSSAFVGDTKSNSEMIMRFFKKDSTQSFNIANISGSRNIDTSINIMCAKHDHISEYLFKSFINMSHIENINITYSDLFNFFDMYKKFNSYYKDYVLNNDMYMSITVTLKTFKKLYEDIAKKYKYIYNKLKIIIGILKSNDYNDISLDSMIPKIKSACANDYKSIFETLILKIQYFIEEYHKSDIASFSTFTFTSPS